MGRILRASPDKGMILKRIYMALMGLLLLSYPYMMITYTHFTPYVIPTGIWVLRLCSAGLAIYLGRLWKDKGFLILSGYLIWIFIRVAIPDSAGLFTERFSESLFSGIWVFSACYGMSRILSPKEAKDFLRICAVIWTVIMAVSSCVGIVAAWQDHRIYTWNDAAFWGIYPIRLMMPYLPTTSGALVSFSIMIALCVIACDEKKPIRILCSIAVLPMILALSLTDSRTSFISTAVGIAALVFICFTRNNRINIQEVTIAESSSIKQLILPVVVSVVVLVAIIFLLMYMESIFHSLRLRRGLLISRALAETAEKKAGVRGFNGGSEVLTGRYELWVGVLKYLKKNPLVLLFGTGKADPMKGINEILGYSMAHVHNMPLMILVESGISGIAIFISFVVYSFRKMMRAFHYQGGLFPIILIAVVLAITAGDLAECFSWMACSNLPLLPFEFIVLGLVNLPLSCVSRNIVARKVYEF